jgi:hypothetical protein
MGFMDKAKKLAEQAQEKLDEAQKNFNQSGSPQAEQPAQTVRYDEHGRPIQEEGAPAAAPTPPAAEPAAESPPTAEPPPAADPPAGKGDANATPDPFKPIQ